MIPGSGGFAQYGRDFRRVLDFAFGVAAN